MDLLIEASESASEATNSASHPIELVNGNLGRGSNAGFASLTPADSVLADDRHCQVCYRDDASMAYIRNSCEPMNSTSQYKVSIKIL
jgi:hypothetical protein